MPVVIFDLCTICNSKVVFVKDLRYNGLRGTCHKCENS